MNIDGWLQWPTKSTDPGVNFVVLIILALLIIAAIVAGATIAIPVLIVIGIAKAAHWYVTRPTPTDQLYAQTEQRSITANFPATEKFLEAHIDRLVDAWGDSLPSYQVYLSMVSASETLYKVEDLNNPLPPIPPSNSIEEGRYRDRLLIRMRKSADAPKTLEIISNTIGESYLKFTNALPPIARMTRERFLETDKNKPLATFPLIDVLSPSGVGQLISDVMAPYYSEEAKELGLFHQLRNRFESNVHEVSGGPNSNKFVWPQDHKGTPAEIVSAYLRGTPFEQFFDALVPFAFADKQRYEHMHVIGGSGHGKTQLLQHLIFHDLKRVKPPALIVIDSQGDMLRKIQRLDLFTGSPLLDRLVLIDPEDVEFPPALNMFDMTNARLSGYSLSHREQIEAGVIELYNYIFGALAAELTQKQGTAFAYVARLMLSIPGSTIHTLRELMEDGARGLEKSPFAKHIEKLDSTSQAFFQNQFFSQSFVRTKQQIARRLYGVLQVPTFDRMFSSRTNKLDMFNAIQGGKIVLINTSKAQLKSDASALFGRYMIALTIRAAFERVAVSVSDRKPAFLIVDEAAEYFDETLETLLSQARKFNVGVLFAHQHLDQLSPALRSSVAANTSIKLAGGVSDRDARALAPDMRTTADFITSMQKYSNSTEFACSVRNMTSNAVRLHIPFGTLEAAPQMEAGAFAQLIARNRERYTTTRGTVRPITTDPSEPGPGPEVVSDVSRPAAPNTVMPTTSAVPRRPVQKGNTDDWRS